MGIVMNMYIIVQINIVLVAPSVMQCLFAFIVNQDIKRAALDIVLVVLMASFGQIPSLTRSKCYQLIAVLDMQQKFYLVYVILVMSRLFVHIVMKGTKINVNIVWIDMNDMGNFVQSTLIAWVKCILMIMLLSPSKNAKMFNSTAIRVLWVKLCINRNATSVLIVLMDNVFRIKTILYVYKILIAFPELFNQTRL